MNTPKKRGRPPKIVTEQIESVASEPAEPEFVMAACLSQYPNPVWVKILVEGKVQKARIPRNLSNKLVGKTIKVVRVSPESSEEYYEFVKNE